MRNLLAQKDVEAVLGILVEALEVRPVQLSDDARLNNDLGADSLDVVEIMMAVEERLGLTISDEQAEKIQTVGDLFELLAELSTTRR